MFAGFEEQPTAAKVEIFLFTQNIPQNTPLFTFLMTSVGTVYNTSFNLTTDYSYSTYTPSTHNQTSANCQGWNHLATGSTVESVPNICYGLYKVNSPDLKFYFYIDWRDTRYTPTYPYGYNDSCTGHCDDIWIWYDGNTQKFYYSNDLGELPAVEISKGEYLRIWDLKGKGVPTTTNFQNYWSNALAILHQYSTSGTLTPLVVWGPKPNYSALGYLVYRSIGTKGQGLGSWSHIATITDPDQFTFSDYSIGESVWEHGDKYVAYKVTAFDDINESEPTNTVEISRHFDVEAKATPVNSEYYTEVSISWDSVHYFPVNGYKIYRSIVGIGQTAGTFSLIHTVTTPDSTSFLDDTEVSQTLPYSLSGNGENIAYYKIVPFNNYGDCYPGFIAQTPLSRFTATVSPSYNQELMLSPLISWQDIDSFSDIIGYKIYRSVRTIGQSPGTYSNIATVSSDQLSYLDSTLLVTGGNVAYYKVRAYRQRVLSDFSNRVDIPVSGFWKKGSSIVNKPALDVYVLQNYPNPFNPSTEITFVLPEQKQVKIAVMNILGQEVAVLENSVKSAGTHTTVFHAQGYPTGVYYLVFHSDGIQSIKKMMYIR